MSKLARSLILGATLAAMNLAGLTAVAQAQANDPDGKHARRLATEAQVGEPYRSDQGAPAAQGQSADAVERFRQGERTSQQQNITDDATQQKLAERWNYYYQATRMSPAELKAWMEARQPADNPTPVPAPPRPDQPTGQPGWLVAALAALAAVLAVVAGLAMQAARRATHRTRVGPAT
jgi:hypothetical protein